MYYGECDLNNLHLLLFMLSCICVAVLKRWGMAKRIRKRAVSIVMLNGEATGVLEVTIPGSQSMVYKIPREELGNCKVLGVNDFNSVYFLFGGWLKGKPQVYIGQAGVRNNGGAILSRLSEHDKKKEFWNEAIVFTNTNDMFGPTELNFLENQFCNMAIDAGRFDVQNGNNPNQGNIRRREAELESYLDDAEIILNILGYKVFESNLEQSTNNQSYSLNTGVVVPPLPDDIEAVGDFILTAMRNLEAAGYVFSEEQMKILLDPIECNKKDLFNMQNSKVAFFKLYNPNEAMPHLVDGRQRYYTPKKVIMHFGDYQVLLSKEWFDRYKHRELFTKWYKTL